MGIFQEIADSVTERIPDVLQQFNSLTEQDPWIRLPPDYRMNFLGDVVAAATSLALLDPENPARCERLLDKAARHGESRLEQGLPDSFLFQEFYLVRESLWVYLRDEHGTDNGMVAEAIVRIDMALSLAAKASLRGYYRGSFQKRGDWPMVIHQLKDEWAPPPPLEELSKPPHGLASAKLGADRAGRGATAPRRSAPDSQR